MIQTLKRIFILSYLRRQRALLISVMSNSLNCLHTDLQIYAVTPIPENQEVLQRDGIPDNIKSFYKVNHIWRFRYDRPFHKGTKDKENEFKVEYHALSQTNRHKDLFETSITDVLLDWVCSDKFSKGNSRSNLTLLLFILVKISVIVI